MSARKRLVMAKVREEGNQVLLLFFRQRNDHALRHDRGRLANAFEIVFGKASLFAGGRFAQHKFRIAFAGFITLNGLAFGGEHLKDFVLVFDMLIGPEQRFSDLLGRALFADLCQLGADASASRTDLVAR